MNRMKAKLATNARCAELINNKDLPEYTGQIIDLFEDFLEEKGVEIENDERDEDDYAAIIYGTDYGYLQDGLKQIMRNWGQVKEETIDE